MQINNIFISRKTYGPDEGKLTGTIAFSGNHGEVKVELRPQHTEAIFNSCAEALIVSAEEVAKNLRSTIIEQQAQCGNLLTQQPKESETEESSNRALYD